MTPGPTKQTRRPFKLELAQRLAFWAGHDWEQFSTTVRGRRRQESFVDQAEFIISEFERAAVVVQWMPEAD